MQPWQIARQESKRDNMGTHVLISLAVIKYFIERKEKKG